MIWLARRIRNLSIRYWDARSGSKFEVSRGSKVFILNRASSSGRGILSIMLWARIRFVLSMMSGGCGLSSRWNEMLATSDSFMLLVISLANVLIVLRIVKLIISFVEWKLWNGL